MRYAGCGIANARVEWVERGVMDKAKMVRRILLFISVVGTTILLILLGIAMMFYVEDHENYETQVAPVLLIPFDVVLLITLAAGTVLFEMRRE
jgi:hypothetical protein